MDVRPVILRGVTVTLRPMKIEDVAELYRAGSDEKLWKWTANFVANEGEMRVYVEKALHDAARGSSLPFVTSDTERGDIIGSTRFGNIDRVNRKVEIGWTWITPDHQRTAVNTEAKLLMLTHAFEVWKCIRVELKTDAFNSKSRNAMIRIGATEEGTLRNHMITDSGRFRDSVYFSIIEGEWPAVKEKLTTMLEQPR
ncbi:MAG: GNAT family N-acetyltransferase [Pyrinomonadaceae bacterium]